MGDHEGDGSLVAQARRVDARTKYTAGRGERGEDDERRECQRLKLRIAAACLQASFHMADSVHRPCLCSK